MWVVNINIQTPTSNDFMSSPKDTQKKAKLQNKEANYGIPT